MEGRETVIYYRSPTGVVGLWVAVLAAPLAWALNLGIGYSLVLVTCVQRTTVPLHLLCAATLLLAACGGVVALREWRRSGSKGPGEGGGSISRSRFMAAIGILGIGFFSLAIVSQWLAAVILPPCAAL